MVFKGIEPVQGMKGFWHFKQEKSPEKPRSLSPFLGFALDPDSPEIHHLTSLSLTSVYPFSLGFTFQLLSFGSTLRHLTAPEALPDQFQVQVHVTRADRFQALFHLWQVYTQQIEPFHLT
jgi:hypothetical protein